MDNAHSNKIGSHGGTIIKIKEGFVEVSIFEANTPPCFRLYFFDANNNRSPIIPNISLETIRPDGVTQIFHCNQIDNYLESFEHIPEPHEFKLHLTINKKIYNVSFTEDEHHHEGHSHHHENGTGILGWIKGKYAHSHNAVDKIDNTMESNERGIQALKISLAGLGATALLQLIVVMISGSVSLLADTIHNFADCATSIPLWIAFALTKRGASRKFTYGYGKTEDIAGIVIILIIFLSACFAAYETIMKFLHPTPMNHIPWVIVAAIIGFIGNELVAIYRIKIGKEIGSVALVADGQHARIDGFTSLAVLLGAIGAWFGFPIIDPIVGMFITLAILFIVKDSVKSIWLHLIDGIEPEILKQIEHAPMHIEGVQSVHDVRARWIGHKVYTDIAINVAPKLSVQEANIIAKKVENSLREHIPLLGVVIVRACSAEKG